MSGQRPDVPRSDANYHAHDHAALKQQVNEKNDPGAAGEIAERWKKVGRRLTDVAIAFKTLEENTGAMWSGRAAEGAQAQFAGFTKATEVLGQQHYQVGESVQQQASAAETAKNSMIDPVAYEPGKMLNEAASSGNPVKMVSLLWEIPAQREKSEEAKQQAVQVMQTRDSTFSSSAATMPTFTELPVTKDDPGQNVRATPAENNNNLGRVGNDINSRNPGYTPPNVGVPPAVVPPGRSTGGDTTRPSGSQNRPPQNTPQRPAPVPNPGQRPPMSGPNFAPGQRPPGNLPPGARPPGGATAARGGGGGPGGGAGKPGGSFGPANPGGGQNMQGGRSGVMPGGPGAGGSSFGPSNAGQAGRGATGAAGAGGMGAGGAGQGGAEDKEHKSADYLIETEDVFGDGQMVAPPVIGG